MDSVISQVLLWRPILVCEWESNHFIYKANDIKFIKLVCKFDFDVLSNLCKIKKLNKR